jgi:hypothetical protein
MSQIADKTKKEGGHFSVAALFLESVFYSKTVRSPRARNHACA